MSLFNLCDDILELIEVELRPRLKYNQVVREYKDPRFHKAANRITKDRRDVHPGRHYLRVIYPTLHGFSSYRIERFKCQDINLHGILIRTTVRDYDTDVDVSSKYSVRGYTHDDIDDILTSIGATRFKSRKKHDKIAMIMSLE
mgnify:FL=1|jgi:hypothetical protein